MAEVAAPIVAPPTIDIEHEIDPTLGDGDHEKFAHIVKRNELTDAMIFGKEITALCGKKWIPTRDPEKFPVCPGCRDRLSSMK
jgi:hypothetical protein